MSDNDVMEMSSDEDSSHLKNFKFKEYSDKFDGEADSGATYSQATSLRSSSPFDAYHDKIKGIFGKKTDYSGDEDVIEGFSQSLTKEHDVSSSDSVDYDENGCDIAVGVEVDSGCDYNFSQYTEASSNTASQSSALTQSDVKAEKAAERLRKKLQREAAAAEKKRQIEERKKLREEKNRKKLAEKQEKKRVQFERNQKKPKECIKYMTLMLDEKLFRTVLCSKAIEAFPHNEVKFSFQQQPVENAITWTRTQLDGSVVEEDWVVIMWPAEDVAKAISESTLVSTFSNISSSVYPNKSIILFIFSMEHYHRKSQNYRRNEARKDAEQREGGSSSQRRDASRTPSYLTREEVEMGLVELQFLAGVSHRHFNDYREFADILGDFTRAIAELLYKKEEEERESGCGWLPSNRETVVVNKEMQGLDKLWLQHLTVFNNTNLDTAKAVAAVYPTPTALFQAYENCASQKERETLLQDIQVKRSGSSSAVSRRLGPELSRKICIAFTETDGEVRLSSKS